jgi:hypothetical protein
MFRTRKLSRLCAALCVLTLSLASAPAASAKTTCQDGPQGRLCISQVDFASFAQQAYQPQYASQWCWAASISMLFRYYKHPVSQPRIVSDVYGAVTNMPAGSGFVIARQLNRRWRDDNGKTFTSRLTAAYDFDAGVNAINNNWIIDQLDQDHPIVVGSRTHAMVGTAIQYFVTPMGPRVVSVGVFDPWPGVGARGLTPDEMRPMHLGGGLRFIASVKVSSDDDAR